MNSGSRFSTLRRGGAAYAVAMALALAFGACAPLPQQADADAAAAASAASAAQAAQAARAAAKPVAPSPPGEQRIAIGGTSGFHTTVKTTPPSQVCDTDAFADGVRYGYALTWNRLIAEAARSGGRVDKRKFDASAVHSQDDQYKIQWDGKERTNACASDGYLIGRIVGTHLAGLNLRDGKPS